MVEIRGKIPKEAENEFRRLAMKKFGYGKGSYPRLLKKPLIPGLKNARMKDRNEDACTYFPLAK